MSHVAKVSGKQEDAGRVLSKIGPEGPPPVSPLISRLLSKIGGEGPTVSDIRLKASWAQDVLKVMPKAVSAGDDGYYRVHYDMLGIEMRCLD